MNSKVWHLLAFMLLIRKVERSMVRIVMMSFLDSWNNFSYFLDFYDLKHYIIALVIEHVLFRSRIL